MTCYILNNFMYDCMTELFHIAGRHKFNIILLFMGWEVHVPDKICILKKKNKIIIIIIKKLSERKYSL